jgi:osmotically inducible protein OsmC
MALSNILAEAGHTPEDVTTDANVTLEMVDGDPTITTIHLTTKGVVPGLDNDTFVQHAQAAKEGCPVSKALAGATIKLDAELIG